MISTPRLIIRRLETAQTRTARALWHESEKVRRKAFKGARRARKQALRLTAEYFGVGEPVPAVYNRWYELHQIPVRPDGKLALTEAFFPVSRLVAF